jgi:hypothetical protein
MEIISKKLSQIMMWVIEKMTPSCEIISKKISRSIDEKLSLMDRLEIKIHILGCILCERYRDQLLAMHRMVGEYSKKIEEETPDQTKGLSEEATQRIKLALKQQKLK